MNTTTAWAGAMGEVTTKPESWWQCDQNDLDELTEIASRLKLIAKMISQVDDLDAVERGTLARMVGNEATDIFELVETFENRLGDA